MQLKIGETLKKLRSEREITMVELAEALSVTPQSVFRWESGASYPDIEMLPRIAEYFSVSLDKLMLDSDVYLTERLNEELCNMRRSGEFRSTLTAYRKEMLNVFFVDAKDAFLHLRLYVEVRLAGALFQQNLHEEDFSMLDRVRENAELLFSMRDGKTTLSASVVSLPRFLRILQRELSKTISWTLKRH